jgi:hypothetical protein
MDKKGIQLNESFPAVLILISLGVLVIMAIFIFVDLGDSSPTITSSSSQTVLIDSTATLSPIGDGITSSNANANNDTWLEFDGVDDVVTVTSSIINSITFWYKNTTTDWTFIANSSGTTYVNGTTGVPELFPVYYNSTDYQLGKTNDSTFVNVSIYDFRVYSRELNEGEPLGLYLLGR